MKSGRVLEIGSRDDRINGEKKNRIKCNRGQVNRAACVLLASANERACCLGN